MQTLVSQQPFPTTECDHFKIFAKFHFFIIEAELFFISRWPLVFLILQIAFVRYAFAARRRKIWLPVMETNRVYFTSLQKLILSVDSAARNVNDKVSANLMASHSWWQDGCPSPSISPLFKAGQKEEQGSHICSFQEPSTWRLLFMPHWPELWHMATPATKEAGKDDLFFSTSIMEVDNSHNLVICTSSL